MASRVDVTQTNAGKRLRGKPNLNSGTVAVKLSTNNAFLIVDALQHLGNPDIKHDFTDMQLDRLSDLADALIERMK